MLTQEHLVLGLNALGRAHTMNYFTDGHRGAAIIAAYYLCQRDDIEPGAARLIAEKIDELWSTSDLCAPFPEEAAEPALTADIAEAVAASTDHLRQAGHNVILPSLALKAMGDLPETVTRSRVAGICRLVEAFTATPTELVGEDPAVPDPAEAPGFAKFALGEALANMERFEGHGQGYTGHLFTHSQAVVDLAQTGYADASEHARGGLALYVKRIRMGPLEGDYETAEHAPRDYGPLTERYWRERPSDSIGIGHCFKYPYAYYSLLDQVDDPGLRRACEADAYRVL